MASKQTYRPVPIFQLAASVAKFKGQRKDELYGTAKLNEAIMTPETHDIPISNIKEEFATKAAAMLNPNVRPEDKKERSVTTEYASRQTMGSMGGILNSANRKSGEVDASEFHFPGKRAVTSANPTYDNLIGGQPPEGDPYQTTAQISGEGGSAALDNKPANKKKMMSEVDPQQMVSPITGELIANYGTWAEDLANKRNREHANEEENKVDDDPIMSKLKQQLASRGAKGVIGLGRVFKIMDDDGSNSLCFNEFKKAMRECGMVLSDAELIMLFKRFDRMNTGNIKYNDFMNTITGSLNARRRRLVNMAFDVLDKDGSGQIDLADIAMAYDVSMHPDFKAGKKTKDQVLLEFLEGFDVGGVKDGIVTRDEFANYYTQISSSIDRDDYFELMIRNAWHISGGEGQAANSANRRVLVTREDGSQYVEEIKNDLGLKSGDKTGMVARLKAQGVNAANISQFDGGDDNKQSLGKSSKTLSKSNYKTSFGPRSPQKGVLPKGSKPSGPQGEPSPGIKLIIAKIKAEMKSRGSGGFIGLQRRFRIMDDDGSKSLSLSEFKKALKEFKMDLSESDLRQLFEFFDTDGSGSIDFEEFVQGVRDPLTDRRLHLVKLAFNVIDSDGSGIVDGKEIASMYDASKHPEVLAKRKTPAQVLREFLDTFDVGGVKDGMVTQAEFINYYTNLSANIDNEDYFELMIRNAWHISGGEGASANSSNMRVLVTDFTGLETAVTLQNDLGLKGPDDINGIYSRLTRQGVKDIMAINGKLLKKVNVNGVEIVTVAGTVSAIDKDDRKVSKPMPVNVVKAPMFTRPTAPTASVANTKPLIMTGSNQVRPGSSGATSRSNHIISETANKNSLGANAHLSNSKGQLASQMYASMKQTTVEKDRATAYEIVGNTLLDVVKVQLLARGPAGIIDLQRAFVEMDTDGSKSLDKVEFREAMKANKLTFSDTQLETLFNYFDTDKSGTIDYVELLNGLRGQLSPKLLVLVHQAFDLMDNTGSGCIDPQQLLTHFDSTRHPDVLTGMRKSEDILKEFLDTFDVGSEVQGKITRDEFVTYYTNIAAAVNDDDYFEIILQKTWHLNENYERNMEKLILQQNAAIKSESTLASRLKQAQQFAEQSQDNSMYAMPNRGDESMPFPPPQSSGSRQNSNFQQRRPNSASAIRRPSQQSTASFVPDLKGLRVEYSGRGGDSGVGSGHNIISHLPVNNNNFGSHSVPNSARPKSAGSVRNSRSHMSSNYNQRAVEPQVPEVDFQEELKALQKQAIECYNQCDFDTALLKFQEVLEATQLMYPGNHPECIKAQKSIALVEKRREAEYLKQGLGGRH